MAVNVVDNGTSGFIITWVSGLGGEDESAPPLGQLNQGGASPPSHSDEGLNTIDPIGSNARRDFPRMLTNVASRQGVRCPLNCSGKACNPCRGKAQMFLNLWRDSSVSNAIAVNRDGCGRGEARWVGFHIRFSQDALFAISGTKVNGNQILETHMQEPNNYGFKLSLKDGVVRVEVAQSAQGGNTSGPIIHTPVAGVWYEYLFRHVGSANPNDGRVDFYLDGNTNPFTATGYTHAPSDDADYKTRFRLGQYHNTWTDFVDSNDPGTSTFHFRAIVMADGAATRQDVRAALNRGSVIEPPPPGPGATPRIQNGTTVNDVLTDPALNELSAWLVGDPNGTGEAGYGGLKINAAGSSTDIHSVLNPITADRPSWPNVLRFNNGSSVRCQVLCRLRSTDDSAPSQARSEWSNGDDKWFGFSFLLTEFVETQLCEVHHTPDNPNSGEGQVPFAILLRTTNAGAHNIIAVMKTSASVDDAGYLVFERTLIQDAELNTWYTVAVRMLASTNGATGRYAIYVNGDDVARFNENHISFYGNAPLYLLMGQYHANSPTTLYFRSIIQGVAEGAAAVTAAEMNDALAVPGGFGAAPEPPPPEVLPPQIPQIESPPAGQRTFRGTLQNVRLNDLIGADTTHAATDRINYTLDGTPPSVSITTVTRLPPTDTGPQSNSFQLRAIARSRQIIEGSPSFAFSPEMPTTFFQKTAPGPVVASPGGTQLAPFDVPTGTTDLSVVLTSDSADAGGIRYTRGDANVLSPTDPGATVFFASHGDTITLNAAQPVLRADSVSLDGATPLRSIVQNFYYNWGTAIVPSPDLPTSSRPAPPPDGITFFDELPDVLFSSFRAKYLQYIINGGDPALTSVGRVQVGSLASPVSNFTLTFTAETTIRVIGLNESPTPSPTATFVYHFRVKAPAAVIALPGSPSVQIDIHQPGQTIILSMAPGEIFDAIYFSKGVASDPRLIPVAGSPLPTDRQVYSSTNQPFMTTTDSLKAVAVRNSQTASPVFGPVTEFRYRMRVEIPPRAEADPEGTIEAPYHYIIRPPDTFLSVRLFCPDVPTDQLQIRYRDDGVDPILNPGQAFVYDDTVRLRIQIPVETAYTIQVIARRVEGTGFTDWCPTSRHRWFRDNNILPSPAAPTVDKPPQSFTDTLLVTVQCPTADRIWATIDGQNPQTSTGFVFKGNGTTLPITLTDNSTINAIGWNNNLNPSPVGGPFVYTRTTLPPPPPMPAPGVPGGVNEFSTAFGLRWTSVGSDHIYYNVNAGGDPTAADLEFTTQLIPITATMTIKAIAAFRGVFSGVTSITFTQVAPGECDPFIDLPPDIVQAFPTNRNFQVSQEIRLQARCSEQIRYTLVGGLGPKQALPENVKIYDENSPPVIFQTATLRTDSGRKNSANVMLYSETQEYTYTKVVITQPEDPAPIELLFNPPSLHKIPARNQEGSTHRVTLAELANKMVDQQPVTGTVTLTANGPVTIIDNPKFTADAIFMSMPLTPAAAANPISWVDMRFGQIVIHHLSVESTERRFAYTVTFP